MCSCGAYCGRSGCTARAAFSAARASARFFGIGTSIARATELACATGLHMQRDSHVRQDLHEDSHVQKDRMCDRTCMCNRELARVTELACAIGLSRATGLALVKAATPLISLLHQNSVCCCCIHCRLRASTSTLCWDIMLGLDCMTVAAGIVIVYPRLTLVSPKQG